MQPKIFNMNVSLENDLLNISVNILRDIYRPFVHFELLYESGQGNYDLVYMNKTIDVCMFLNNRKLNIFFQIMYRILSDYVELPERCPIRRVNSFSNFFF